VKDAPTWMKLFAGRTRDGDVASEVQDNVALSDDRQVGSDTGISVATPWAESTIRDSVQEASDSLAARRKAF
jgi:hypothetical protein